jgi:hypothetical protein
MMNLDGCLFLQQVSWHKKTVVTAHLYTNVQVRAGSIALRGAQV